MYKSKSIELLKKISACQQNYSKEYDYLCVETDLSQFSIEDIFEHLKESDINYIKIKIEEMLNSDLYQRQSSIHGKKHIENVMLFAAIISLLENVDSKDIDLLMEAAKYHDQGRVNDFDEQHGIQSAYILGEDLKDKYTLAEVKIMQAAIIFHDDRTEGDTIHERENVGFSNIVARLQLANEDIERARMIGNILKDADALDRARFAPNFNPIDERFLRTKTSKKMIKMSFQLHEAYSQEELETLLEKENDKIKQDITDYSNATSPIRAKNYYIRVNKNKIL